MHDNFYGSASGRFMGGCPIYYLRKHQRIYRIAGMFGGVNVWRIAELKVIGEVKFGEWIDFGHKVPLPAKIWLVKTWRIMHD